MRDTAVERWLRIEVVKAYAESIEHPELAVSSEEMDKKLQQFFLERYQSSTRKLKS